MPRVSKISRQRHIIHKALRLHFAAQAALVQLLAVHRQLFAVSVCQPRIKFIPTAAEAV